VTSEVTQSNLVTTFTTGTLERRAYAHHITMWTGKQCDDKWSRFDAIQAVPDTNVTATHTRIGSWLERVKCILLSLFISLSYPLFPSFLSAKFPIYEQHCKVAKYTNYVQLWQIFKPKAQQHFWTINWIFCEEFWSMLFVRVTIAINNSEVEEKNLYFVLAQAR